MQDLRSHSTSWPPSPQRKHSSSDRLPSARARRRRLFFLAFLPLSSEERDAEAWNQRATVTHGTQTRRSEDMGAARRVASGVLPGGMGTGLAAVAGGRGSSEPRPSPLRGWGGGGGGLQAPPAATPPVSSSGGNANM